MDIAHLHFLVAEADTVQRTALVDMLGQLGASRVTDVPDGHTALRCFQAGFTPAVDVAIIDLDLPGMDGLELIRNLAALDMRRAPDRDRRAAGQPAVLGRDAGPGLRRRSARHDRQAGRPQPSSRRCSTTTRRRAARRERASRRRASPSPTVGIGPAEAPVRTLLPAEDRAGHRPGQGPGSVRALAPSGARRAGAGRLHRRAGSRTTASTSSTGA